MGQVASVAGGIVRVRLRDETLSALVMIEGESYRIGQIGGFFRIPLGYANLYAVCTQVGADAVPAASTQAANEPVTDDRGISNLSGYGWMTIVLFGEGIGGEFTRGVGQYPTVGDEVHIVTYLEQQAIYRSARGASLTIPVGSLASTSGIPASLDIARMVTRHSVVVGSTGSGKSNFVTVMLESLSGSQFPNARVLVIDPHGEYSSALQGAARIFRVRPDVKSGESRLSVPFWALPFDELQKIAFGSLPSTTAALVRDELLALKTEAASLLATPIASERLTADSPVPFSIRRLWYELDSFERATFKKSGNQQTRDDMYPPDEAGEAAQLKSDTYPAASSYNQAPYKNQRKRNIERQLEFMASRLRDERFSFLFSPGEGLEPDVNGRIEADLDELIKQWIGPRQDSVCLRHFGFAV